MSPKAKIQAGMVKSSLRRLCSTGARLQQHSNRNVAGPCQLSACLLLSACEKHTHRETSASRALQVLQISDLPKKKKKRHSIYS